jgi:hypothetical protein
MTGALPAAWDSPAWAKGRGQRVSSAWPGSRGQRDFHASGGEYICEVCL